MKKTLLSLLLLCYSAVQADAAVLYGSIVDLTGKKATSDTTITFSLMNCATNIPKVQGSAVLAPLSKTVSLSITGQLTGMIIGNDLLTCGTLAGQSYYKVIVTNAGQVLFAKNYFISGKTFDISSATALNDDPTGILTSVAPGAGELLVGSAGGTALKVSATMSTTTKVLTATGDGTNAGTPVWADAPVQKVRRSETGAVTRTVPEKLADIISVKDFGAKGDGTDDSASLTTSLTVVCTGGGTLNFPKGIYSFDNSVAPLTGTNCSNITISMDEGTTLKCTSTANNCWYMNGGANQTYQNITVAGPGTLDWTTSGGIITARNSSQLFYLRGVTNPKLKGFTAYNGTSSGLAVENVSFGSFSDLYFHDLLANGLFLTNSVGNVFDKIKAKNIGDAPLEFSFFDVISSTAPFCKNNVATNISAQNVLTGPIINGCENSTVTTGTIDTTYFEAFNIIQDPATTTTHWADNTKVSDITFLHIGKLTAIGNITSSSLVAHDELGVYVRYANTPPTPMRAQLNNLTVIDSKYACAWFEGVKSDVQLNNFTCDGALQMGVQNNGATLNYSHLVIKNTGNVGLQGATTGILTGKDLYLENTNLTAGSYSAFYMGAAASMFLDGVQIVDTGSSAKGWQFTATNAPGTVKNLSFRITDRNHPGALYTPDKLTSFPDVFTPQMFGGKGDGTTDDRIAIQAAYDGIIVAGGGTVVFPPGTYRIDSFSSANSYAGINVVSTSTEKQINTACLGGATIKSNLGSGHDLYGVFHFGGKIANSKFDGCNMLSDRSIVFPVAGWVVEALDFDGGAPNGIRQFTISHNTFRNFARDIWGSAELNITENHHLKDSADWCTQGGCTGLYSWPLVGAGQVPWTITNNTSDGFYAYTLGGASAVAATSSKRAADGYQFGCFTGFTSVGNIVRNHSYEGMFASRCYVSSDQSTLFTGAGSMTAGSKTLSVTGGNFTVKDVGRPVGILNAGAAQTNSGSTEPLYSHIAAYISATQVTLLDAASTTVTGKNIRIDNRPYPGVMANNIIDSTPIPGETGSSVASRTGIRIDEDSTLAIGNVLLNANFGIMVNGIQALGGATDYTIAVWDVRLLDNHIGMASGVNPSKDGISISGAQRFFAGGNTVEWSAAALSAANGIHISNGSSKFELANNAVRAYGAPLGSTNVTGLNIQQSQTGVIRANSFRADTCFVLLVAGGDLNLERDNSYNCNSVVGNVLTDIGLYVDTTMKRQEWKWTPTAGMTAPQWLRVLQYSEYLRGTFSWSSYYDGNRTAGSADVVCQGYGGASMIREKYFFGNGNSGLRVSSDGGNGCYLDWQLPSATAPKAITFTFDTDTPGMILRTPFTAGATAGSTSVVTWSGPTLPISQTIVVKGSAGANCNVVYFDGKVISTTCP